MIFLTTCFKLEKAPGDRKSFCFAASQHITSHLSADHSLMLHAEASRLDEKAELGAPRWFSPQQAVLATAVEKVKAALCNIAKAANKVAAQHTAQSLHLLLE